MNSSGSDSADKMAAPDIEDIKDFYDSVYYSEASERATDTLRNHYERLCKRLGVEAGQNVLDVACGTGEWLKVCDERGAAISGIDLSERAIAFCEELIPNGDFYAQSAEELPLLDNTFDVVTCFGSLEHFVDPLSSLKEMVRVAKAKGVFLLLVPNKDFLTRRLGLFHGTEQTISREDVRTIEGWEELFSAAGLRVEARWKDLHILNRSWIRRGPWYGWPMRAIQPLLLAVWPLKWQYQVYFQCSVDSLRS